MQFTFPRVYPILDASYVPAHNRLKFLQDLGKALTDAGITLLEYRNKVGDEAQLLEDAEVLREALPAEQVKLILDDRADLVARIGFNGVHVDAGDLSVYEARVLLGREHIIGTFAGSDQLLPKILDEPADYFAVGPVFSTHTKQTDKRPIGVDGVRRLRAAAGPDVVLTAAAGITLDTAPLVLVAGATSVAVAKAIFGKSNPASEFRKWMELLG